MITREQLELVVQKKKVSEVYSWFQDHFVSTPLDIYIAKCPFLIVQGPPGCGKTTTLQCVARELKIPIKEYSDTTDTTAISFEINQRQSDEDRSFDKRKASRFEQFVYNSLIFNPLYPSTGDSQPLARADSEFSDSDEEPPTQATQPKKPSISGIIIHVESPLMFSKSQKIFISSMAKIIKMIHGLSRSTPRRIAIVFETLETDKDILSLPTKFKQAIGMQMIKFNPVIRANMKKFIEILLRKYQSVTIDKDTIDTLITDCDGDLQACINTIDMIRRKSDNHNIVYMGLDDSPLKKYQVSKRQKLNPDRFKLNTALMRDVTRSLGFFHNLGKIFYQKRLYPELRNGNSVKRSFRSIDRPFPTENDTEFLVSRLDAEPKKLMPWLHQHYHKFCGERNVEKASLFLEHLSDVDTISMNSMQSSQFYEMHGQLDQIQLYLAVSATVYSLYEDQSSKTTKPSHKKLTNNEGSHVIKTSVESTQNGSGELFSFGKPASLSLPKVVDDHQAILTICSEKLMEYDSACVDTGRFLVDYVPYLGAISNNWSTLANRSHLNGHTNSIPKICTDSKMTYMVKTLNTFEQDPKLDYDAQHESLLEYLGDIEQTFKIREPNETDMDIS